MKHFMFLLLKFIKLKHKFELFMYVYNLYYLIVNTTAILIP